MLVVALAFLLAVVGVYVTTLGSPAHFGWFGYAPMTGITIITPPDLTPFEQLLVWVGLILLWAGVSVLFLQRPPERSPGD